MTHRLARSLIVSIVCLVVAAAALAGLGSQALNLVVLGSILVGIGDRLWGLSRRDVLHAPWRREEARPWKAHRTQLTLRILFGLLWATTLVSLVGVMSVFGPTAQWVSASVFIGALVAWLCLALFPRHQVDLAHNLGLSFGILALSLAWVPLTFPSPAPVTLSLPLRGEVAVLQGGPTPLYNHHYLVNGQRYALDLLWLDGGIAVDGSGDAKGFGQPVLAPCDGEVVTVVEGFADGELDPTQPAGNHVVIAVADGLYILLAHLAEGSIDVREGSIVERGAPIAALGNSGNSTMAHLHIQVQNQPAFAPDAETFPVRFVGATRSPRRGDVFRTELTGLATTTAPRRPQ